MSMNELWVFGVNVFKIKAQRRDITFSSGVVKKKGKLSLPLSNHKTTFLLLNFAYCECREDTCCKRTRFGRMSRSFDKMHYYQVCGSSRTMEVSEYSIFYDRK